MVDNVMKCARCNSKNPIFNWSLVSKTRKRETVNLCEHCVINLLHVILATKKMTVTELITYSAKINLMNKL